MSERERKEEEKVRKKEWLSERKAEKKSISQRDIVGGKD